MDAFFVGDSLSGRWSKRERTIGFWIQLKKMISTKKITFVKLMSLEANTASALNSMPGPSSRVKTMLV
jgi:hypothetical protein